MSNTEKKINLEDRIIDTLLKTHGLVTVGVIAVIVYGIFSYSKMPVDAFPDISPVMVPVFAEAHGMAPEEVELLISYPIESAMNGLPGVRELKSTSAFGMAVIYVYFDDDIDMYFARQLVAERLAAVMPELPDMHEPPTLGPISTGLGQIFIYYLKLDETVADTGGKSKDAYLRELNDWQIKKQLSSVRGVTDILSVGGEVLQYQIRLNSTALVAYDLTLEDVVKAVNANNANAGGNFVVVGSEEHLVRGLGLLDSLEDIRNIPLKTEDGVAVVMSDIAEVAYGAEVRRGVVTKDGTEEVVSGMVLKLFGANTSEVIERLYAKLADVQKSLPKGVELVSYYEQKELVDKATWTVKKSLLIGAALVVLSLFLFLGNLRSAFIVALSLPICALIAIIFMGVAEVSANLMSLGGIAIGIGMLGDGAIVMVENIFRHLGNPDNKDKSRLAIIHMAASEVSRSVVYSIVVIVLVFTPIFSLQSVESKMFVPMALSVIFALLGSIVMAIAIAPVLSLYLLKKGEQTEPRLSLFLKKLYRPALALALRHKVKVIAGALLAFAISMGAMGKLGREFIPQLEEGSILIAVNMAPSISIQKATETIMTLERRIIKHEMVEEIISRIGRPEAGSHPHPVNTAEVHIELKPKSEWPSGMTKQKLIEDLNADIGGFPGVLLSFTQPIQNAFDELLSGTKAALAIKIVGEDLDVLRTEATDILASIKDVRGFVDGSVEQNYGQPQVQVIADREACRRLGVAVGDILETVELGVGGEVVSSLYLNTRRFGIHVRMRIADRRDNEAISRLLIPTESGARVELGEVAEIKNVVGQIQIRRENNTRRIVVQGNISGRDMGSVVDDIKKIVATRNLPDGVMVEYGGQFANQERAMRRLQIIVPLVLLGVFLVLWSAFGSYGNALLIMANVPLALVGGIAGLFIASEYLSVPAAIGFIALFGIAVQNGLVLVGTINSLRTKGGELRDILIEAGVLRLRPVLMTALTTVLGLLPLLLSSGIGSEVQRPLAVVVVYGLITSTMLTLFVIPSIYGLVYKKKHVENPEG